DVFFQDFIARRLWRARSWRRLRLSTGCAGARTTGSARRRYCQRKRGYRCRVILAPMAGMAGDLKIAFERSLVDIKDHLDHLASGVLLLLFVRGIVPLPIVIDVTKITASS